MNKDTEIEYNPTFKKTRWVACFDLLGIRKLIGNCDEFRVFTQFEKALREFKEQSSRVSISSVWFSDTFLIYSESDSKSDFPKVEAVSRWFTHFLLLAEIPVRGAIACGDFYVDSENQLYFGKALVESYELQESQDWIGFVLSKSAISRLDEVGLPACERLNYAYHDIPLKKANQTQRLPACVMGESSKINGENMVLQALVRMKERESEDSIIRKYVNTIEFLEKNQRSF